MDSPRRRRKGPPQQGADDADSVAPRRPSADALAAALAVARRNHERTAQIRRSFIERSQELEASEDPPLATMLRGGRGGSVRLRLLMSMLWLGSAPPHDITYPARAWATLLDLRQPEGAGSRRVLEATRWLETNNFLTVEARPGHPNRLTLLEESGQDRRYRVPGDAFNRARSRKADDAILQRHRYVQLPASFWTSGYAAVLSGPAVAMLLILLAERAGRDEDRALWFSPAVAKLRYGLAPDTRSAGLDELRRAGLITVRRQIVASDVFDVQRFRNTYILDLTQLERPAEIPPRVRRSDMGLSPA